MSVARALTAGEFRDRYSRPSFLWTARISNLAGAHLARIAILRGWRPNAITTAGLLLAILASTTVAVLYPLSPVGAALVAFGGWQLAYALDCADGQLARATGSASATGAVFDLTCDWIVHVVVLAAVLSTIPATWAGGVALTGATVITGTWLFSLAYEGWRAPLGSAHTLRGRNRLVDVVRQSRDYGLQVAVLSVTLAVGPTATLIALGAISLMNLAFVLQRAVVLGRSQSEVSSTSTH